MRFFSEPLRIGKNAGTCALRRHLNFLRLILPMVMFLFMSGYYAPQSLYAEQASAKNEKLSISKEQAVQPDPQKILDCDYRELPQWPFLRFEAGEREARLRFFLKLYDFRVKQENTGDEATCAPLLKRLQSLEKVKVLEPTYRGKAHPKNTTCTNLIDMTMYGTFKEDLYSALLRPDGKNASVLSIADKEKASDFFYRVTNRWHMEYYDLSKYFSGNTWAALGEGLAIQYNTRHVPKVCFRGFEAYMGTYGRVFNPDTCAAYFFPQLMASGQRLIWDGMHARESPQFTAYIEVDGKLYLFQFARLPTWSSFAEILSPRGGRPIIVLTPLSDPDAIVQDVPLTSACLYEVSKGK